MPAALPHWSPGGFFSFYSYRWRPAIITLVIVLGGIGAIVQNVISDPFMRVTVDDPTTLSGRTIIWEALWAYYRNAPYFGAGYGSFWDIGRASPINQFGRGWLLEIAQGHNGYLDLLITIGPVGLGLCVYAAFVWPILRLLNWRRGDKQVGALLLSTLVFLIAHNATESTLFDRDLDRSGLRRPGCGNGVSGHPAGRPRSVRQCRSPGLGDP
ncbi:O-antigen ligase family protein [Novosphingobium colocasiae]